MNCKVAAYRGVLILSLNTWTKRASKKNQYMYNLNIV